MVFTKNKKNSYFRYFLGGFSWQNFIQSHTIGTKEEEQTRFIYDARPQEWLDYSGGKDRKCFWQTEMSLFMDHLGADKTVIEVGCGPATDGKYLLAAGCRQLFSVDYSIGMLNLANQIWPESMAKPNLCQMDIYDPGFAPESFDGFWASAVFVHLSQPDEALNQISRITKPQGIGFISVKEGLGERIDEKTGYYFRDFPVDGPDSFQSHLSQAGFTIIHTGKIENPSRNWLTYLVQKE